MNRMAQEDIWISEVYGNFDIVQEQVISERVQRVLEIIDLAKILLNLEQFEGRLFHEENLVFQNDRCYLKTNSQAASEICSIENQTFTLCFKLIAKDEDQLTVEFWKEQNLPFSLFCWLKQFKLSILSDESKKFLEEINMKNCVSSPLDINNLLELSDSLETGDSVKMFEMLRKIPQTGDDEKKLNYHFIVANFMFFWQYIIFSSLEIENFKCLEFNLEFNYKDDVEFKSFLYYQLYWSSCPAICAVCSELLRKQYEVQECNSSWLYKIAKESNVKSVLMIKECSSLNIHLSFLSNLDYFPANLCLAVISKQIVSLPPKVRIILQENKVPALSKKFKDQWKKEENGMICFLKQIKDYKNIVLVAKASLCNFETAKKILKTAGLKIEPLNEENKNFGNKRAQFTFDNRNYFLKYDVQQLSRSITGSGMIF